MPSHARKRQERVARRRASKQKQHRLQRLQKAQEQATSKVEILSPRTRVDTSSMRDVSRERSAFLKAIAARRY